MTRLALIIVLTPLVSAHSQLPAYSAAVAIRPQTQVTARTAPRYDQPEFRKEERFALRLFTGTVGMVAGVYAGALIGGASARECGGCDDPGLPEALVGASIGGIIGTGVGVGILSLGDGCSTGGRVGMGMGGAALGGVLGLLLAPVTNGYSIPGGAVIVGSAMAGSCAPHR